MLANLPFETDLHNRLRPLLRPLNGGVSRRNRSGNTLDPTRTFEDAERISVLIIGLSEEFIVGEFTAEGRARFLRDHSMIEVQRRLAGDFRFYLAENGNELAGVAAIRSNTPLCYLFFAKPYQCMGLARRL